MEMTSATEVLSWSGGENFKAARGVSMDFAAVLILVEVIVSFEACLFDLFQLD